MLQWEEQDGTTPFEHLIPFGFAPGGYVGTCSGCSKKIANIDKRAICCRACAELALAKYTANPPKPDPRIAAKARLRKVSQVLIKYGEGCEDARAWGGPTIFPVFPLDEAQAIQVGRDINIVLGTEDE